MAMLVSYLVNDTWPFPSLSRSTENRYGLTVTHPAVVLYRRPNETSRCRLLWELQRYTGTRTRNNTNPNGTEANAAGRSGNARALRKQSKCGVIHEGEGHWPTISQKLQKARHSWVARTPQKQ